MAAPDEATELIATLDRALLEGGNITTYKPNTRSVLDDIARSTNIFADDGVPASQSIYPDVTLSTHLRQHDQTLATLQHLQAKAAALALNKDTVTSAEKLLITEHARLATTFRIPDFENAPLRVKLKLLRAAQQQPQEQQEQPATSTSPSPTVKTFAISTVSSVSSNGNPNTLVHTHLPDNTSWPEHQRAAQAATNNWQAADDGFAQGYSLEDGKWLYLIVAGGIPQTAPHDLSTETEYIALREALAAAKDIKIVIWHERLWTASLAARAQWAEICKEENERDDDDWTKKNGWEMFSPDLDPDFDGDVEWSMYDDEDMVGTTGAGLLADEEEGEGGSKRKRCGEDAEGAVAKRARASGV
ncbi:hypothetical protein LTR08_006672 [Meristemomyces frigidus]|nr:hypothetical protein LTR08_006672 [Meristemomyces frigidus]